MVLTYADILIVQLGGAVAVEAQAAVLAVLAPRVVLAAHAGHHVQEVDVAAAVGVAVALAVCGGEEERAGDMGLEHLPSAGRRRGATVEEGPAWGNAVATASIGLGCAGQKECTQFSTTTGGSGWKSSLTEQSRVRVPVILGCGQAGASPLQSQDMISFRNCIIMGAGSGGESGGNYRAALLMSRTLCLGLALGRSWAGVQSPGKGFASLGHTGEWPVGWGWQRVLKWR